MLGSEDITGALAQLYDWCYTAGILMLWEAKYELFWGIGELLVWGEQWYDWYWRAGILLV